MKKEAETTLDITDDNLLFEGGAEALNVLLGGADASEAVDAEQWARVLQDRAQQLDTLNVQAMLAAATQGGGAKLGQWLIDSGNSATALGSRLHRYESITRGAEGAGEAGGGAARADTNARALLTELDGLASLLDPPQLRDLDSLAEISLGSVDGRECTLSAGASLLAALRGVKCLPPEKRWVLRLNGVKDRIRRLERARDALAAAISRHLNNALVHLGNEALSQSHATSLQHHTQLKPQAQHVRLLRMMDEKAYQALLKVYVGTWSRVHERAVRGAGEGARAQLVAASPTHIDHILDTMLSTVDSLYTAEQEFCTNFFCLDADIKGDNSDGDRSEGGSAGSGGGAAGGRGGAETRKLMQELFPALEQELLSTIAALDKHPYGAMRALACVSRRVLGDGADGSGGAAGARAALAAAAVAAKRAADRTVQERVASASDHVKQASRRTQCGILGFIRDLETFACECERIFSGSARRADLERWYCALATAALQAIGTAEHPRTPRSVVQMENYHALYGALSAPPLRRAPALDTLRASAKTHYNDALRHYVTHSFGRPLEKLNQFFEGVAEAVASGVREEEVCYRAAYSKHELKRLLQLYPANEVRKSLHRLYRTVEKQLSDEAGLLQVVWRAMQEEFIAQHHMLQGRIAACYPGAGLSLPLTIQDILDAFSDIAREH